MFSIKSTNSNALKVASLLLSLTSLCDGRFRGATTSRTTLSAAASTKHVLARASVGTDLANVAGGGCPDPVTVTVTVTGAPVITGSLSSTYSPPSTIQPLPNSTVVSATSVILDTTATSPPPTPAVSSASSVVSPTSIVSSSSAAAPPPSTTATTVSSLPATSTTATTVSSLPATSADSSASSAASSSALPGSGFLTITSKCPFPVYCILTSAQDSTELWKPFPTDGYNLTFSDYVMPNGTELPVWLGFSKTPDSGSTNGHAQFGFTWESAKHLVKYQLSEESTNGTDPFMLNGYNAWPMPNNTGYQFCNGLHCGAGEQPCGASYQKGEIPTATADNPYGNKTSVCPDFINLNFQLCTDVWT